MPIFADYRVPQEVLAAASKPAAAEVDGSWLAIVSHWRLVVAELLERGVNLYDPVVLAGPWPGVRTAIFNLLDSDTRLRAALTRR